MLREELGSQFVGDVRRGEWRDGESRLSRNLERLPAGREDPYAGTFAQQRLGQVSACSDDVLAIVEDEQQGRVAKVAQQGLEKCARWVLPQAERGRYGTGDPSCVAAFGGQVREPCPIRKGLGGPGSDLQCESRLADARRPRQRDEARGPEQLDDLRDLLFPSNESAQKPWQVLPKVPCRAVGFQGGGREDAHRGAPVIEPGAHGSGSWSTGR